MCRDPRLLMAAKRGAPETSALMVNEPFAEQAVTAKNAGKQGSGIFLLFFNTL
jgi:hypothetical protein